MRHPEISEEVLEAANSAELADENRQQSTHHRDQRKSWPIFDALHGIRPQTSKKKLGQWLAIGASLGAVALLGLSTQDKAHADGVVVKSKATKYAKGDIVQEGQSVSLGPSESIVILHASGELVTLTESSVFGDHEEDETPNVSAIDAAVWNERRADMGGTRAQDFEDCLESARKRDDLTEQYCAKLFPQDGNDGPQFDLVYRGNPDNVYVSSPLRLSLQASFDANVTCTLRGVDNDMEQSLPVGPGGKSSLRLTSGVKANLPRRGGRVISVPSNVGIYRVTCIAVDVRAKRAVDAAGESLGDEVALSDLYQRFALVSGASLVSAHFEFQTVSN